MSTNGSKNDFFPNIREALSDPRRFKDFKIECAICYRFLNLKSRPQDACGNEENCSSAVVLFCGHVFGRSCIVSWVKTLDPSKCFNCPYCRQGSAHRYHNYLYPIHSAENARKAPLCLSEGGSLSNAASLGRASLGFDYIASRIVTIADEALPGLIQPISKTKAYREVYKYHVVVLVQWSWGITSLIGLGVNGKHRPRWFTWSSLVKIVGRSVVPANTSHSSLSTAKTITYPWIATQDGECAVSQTIRRGIASREDVWSPYVVSFGIGFRASPSAGMNTTIVESMTNDGFIGRVVEALDQLMWNTGHRERNPSLLR